MSGRWNTLLFAAAADQARLAKAHRRGAAAIILDRADAVPPERKPSTRGGLRAAASILAEGGQGVALRINAGRLAAVADLAAAATAAVPRATGLAPGSEDFSLALGVAPTADSPDLPAA